VQTAVQEILEQDKKFKKKEKTMKKLICLVGVGVLFVSMVLAGCASVQMQKTAVTKSDLSALKGKWEGWTTFASFQANPVLTILEINNDTVPVQGKITLNNLPQGVAARFPADAKTAGNNVIVDFKNARISDQGTLIGTSGENFYELTYYAGEKPKFNGWFYYWGSRGTVTLNKK
jgi:hypothetical protein